MFFGTRTISQRMVYNLSPIISVIPMRDAPGRSLLVNNNISSSCSSFLNPQIKICKILMNKTFFVCWCGGNSSSGVLCASCSISSTFLHGTGDNARQRIAGQKEHENNNRGRFRCEAVTGFEGECEESNVLLLKSIPTEENFNN